MKVPKFKNVKEERKFWDYQESTDYLDDFEETKDVVFVRPKKQVISLRLEPQVINKLKELADKEGLRPTTYARMLIIRAIRNKAA
jgi:predicted DNA binding CopG/RHH family protein